MPQNGARSFNARFRSILWDGLNNGGGRTGLVTAKQSCSDDGALQLLFWCFWLNLTFTWALHTTKVWLSHSATKATLLRVWTWSCTSLSGYVAIMSRGFWHAMNSIRALYQAGFETSCKWEQKNMQFSVVFLGWKSRIRRKLSMPESTSCMDVFSLREFFSALIRCVNLRVADSFTF